MKRTRLQAYEPGEVSRVVSLVSTNIITVAFAVMEHWFQKVAILADIILLTIPSDPSWLMRPRPDSAGLRARLFQFDLFLFTTTESPDQMRGK